jgi:hypothetical protein
MSLVEAVANVVVGYGVAVLTQVVVFPMFVLEATLAQNLWIGGAHDVLGFARWGSRRRAVVSFPNLLPHQPTRPVVGDWTSASSC